MSSQKKTVNVKNSSNENTGSASITLKKQQEELAKMSEKLNTNTEKVRKFKSRMSELKQSNTKLAENYKLSIKMIVDISNLLQHYNTIFTKMETLMENLEETFEFSAEDFRYVNQITDESINQIHEQLTEQIDGVAEIFRREGMQGQADELKNLVSKTANESIDKVAPQNERRREEGAPPRFSPNSLPKPRQQEKQEQQEQQEQQQQEGQRQEGGGKSKKRMNGIKFLFSEPYPFIFTSRSGVLPTARKNKLNTKYKQLKNKYFAVKNSKK